MEIGFFHRLAPAGAPGSRNVWRPCGAARL